MTGHTHRQIVRMTSLAAVCIAASGCVMKQDYERAVRAREQKQTELNDVRKQLDEARAQLKTQASQELVLRRQIAQLNEQVGTLREKNRSLEDKVGSAQRTGGEAQERLETVKAAHAQRIKELREANEQVLAQRDLRIEQLKQRIRQLEALVAQGRTSQPPETKSPPPPPLPDDKHRK